MNDELLVLIEEAGGMEKALGLLRSAINTSEKDSEMQSEKWIPVGHHMPKWGEKVLVWTGEQIETAARWNPPQRPWQWEWGDGTKAHVTHWMPLPKPPQEFENPDLDSKESRAIAEGEKNGA